MQRALSFALAALFGAALAAPAGAQTPSGAAPTAPVSPVDAFMQQDTDGDGKVSLDEIKASQNKRFDEMDTDNDGTVTAKEANAVFQSKVPPEAMEKMKAEGIPGPGDMIVKRLDTDGDGKVERTEFVQPAVETFKAIDANNDGYVTKDEVVAFGRKMQEEMQKQIERMKEQQKEQQPAAPAPSSPPAQ